MKIVDKAKNWLFTVALRKGIKKVALVAVAWLSSVGLEQIGVTLDAEQFQAWLILALVGVFDMLRNYLKVKHGMNWL